VFSRMDVGLKPKLRIVVCVHFGCCLRCAKWSVFLIRRFNSPSSGRIFEAWLTSMLREGWRLTEMAADGQRGGLLGPPANVLTVAARGGVRRPSLCEELRFLSRRGCEFIRN
jgi:hypothetical protein